MFWFRFGLRLIASVLFPSLTSDAPCSKHFTLTSFTVKLMDWFKSWRSLTIAANLAIGWLGFNRLIDPTFAVYRQR